jgi:GNAT superfamily N-acetyltransferase
MSITVTYLEMTDPADLRPAREVPGARFRVVRDPAVNRRLYEGVGGPYRWTQRLPWTDAQYARLAARIETRVAELDGVEAGFAELEPQGPCEVEILSFGLLQPFHGRGLGGAFLTDVLRRAWALHPEGTRRVWLHTCSLDGPHALANYTARGLRPYREEIVPG